MFACFIRNLCISGLVRICMEIASIVSIAPLRGPASCAPASRTPHASARDNPAVQVGLCGADGAFITADDLSCCWVPQMMTVPAKLRTAEMLMALGQLHRRSGANSEAIKAFRGVVR